MIRIFGYKKEEERGGRTKLYCEELHSLYFQGILEEPF
jgi:hypothetical protein